MPRATKLTPKERELFEHLKELPGGKLRRHIKPTNTVCFRLLDANINPVANYREGVVDNLIDKKILVLDGQDYVLSATSDTYK